MKDQSNKSKVLSEIPFSELRDVLILVKAGVSSSYTLEEIKEEISRRQLDELYNEAKTRFGTTLDNLKD